MVLWFSKSESVKFTSKEKIVKKRKKSEKKIDWSNKPILSYPTNNKKRKH